MNHDGILLPSRAILSFCDTMTLGRLEATGRAVREAVGLVVSEVLEGVEVRALRSGTRLKVLSAYHEPKLLEFTVPKERNPSCYTRLVHPCR